MAATPCHLCSVVPPSSESGLLNHAASLLPGWLAGWLCILVSSYKFRVGQSKVLQVQHDPVHASLVKYPRSIHAVNQVFSCMPPFICINCAITWGTPQLAMMLIIIIAHWLSALGGYDALFSLDMAHTHTVVALICIEDVSGMQLLCQQQLYMYIHVRFSGLT